MSRTLWFACLFNISFFIIFLIVAEIQFSLINQAGTHLTWSSWSFFSVSVQTFNYQLGMQSSIGNVAPLGNVVEYPNYLTWVFWAYSLGNLGFIQEFRKKESKNDSRVSK
jgi:hypothetical protein